jgi:cytochrome c oxidase subunit 2
VADNTPANLTNWIRDPQTIKPGVLMPAFTNLSATDLTALVDYLEALK